MLPSHSSVHTLTQTLSLRAHGKHVLALHLHAISISVPDLRFSPARTDRMSHFLLFQRTVGKQLALGSRTDSCQPPLSTRLSRRGARPHIHKGRPAGKHKGTSRSTSKGSVGPAGHTQWPRAQPQLSLASTNTLDTPRSSPPTRETRTEFQTPGSAWPG